jgi:flagellar export protein FliJ
MKKYSFRLARVLRIRRVQEMLRHSELMARERALVEQQEKLKLFENERDVQFDSMALAQKQRLSVARQVSDWKYLGRIARVVEFQGDIVTEFDRRKEAAKARYFEAKKKKRALERLSDLHHAEWIKEMIREEQKIADEASTLRSRGEIQ